MATRSVLLLCFILHNLLSGRNEVNSARVTTQNGVVEGSEGLTVERNRTRYVFMGIPYAEAPIGNLRFEPPKPARNWTGVWNATYQRSVCVQAPNSSAIIGSEDCLHLNVFTTELRNDSLKPVMFWIHGGGFRLGSGDIGEEGADYLLNEGVVVVTLNYRLGVFGFLSTEDDVVPGNNGLKDQVVALRWVKTNIARFGGDPNKVTIFGVSAGSTSVSYLVQSRLAAGLFHAAIMESGTTTCTWSLSRTSRQYAFKVGERLRIHANESSRLVHKMRSVSYSELQSASFTELDLILQTTLIESLQMAPVKERQHPEAVFTSNNNCESLSKGEFNRVPLLLGFNSGEGNLWAAELERLRLLLAVYDASPGMLVPVDQNISSTSSVGRSIHAHYIGKFGLMYRSLTGFLHYFGDEQFVYGIRQYVKLVRNYVDAYYYEFSYEGSLGNPARGKLKGVAHGEETFYIFRAGPRSDDASPNDKRTRKRLVRLWANFAKHGNPTPAADSLLENVIWKVASSSLDLKYLEIGDGLKLRSDPHPKDMHFWDNLYARYGNSLCNAV